MVKKFLYISVLSFGLFACTQTPKEAYFNHGEPESLLDYSSEVVNLKLDSPTSIQEMIDVINKEQPTRAEIKCVSSDPVCREAKKIIHQFGVKVKYRASNLNVASLYYERILARDCQNRYIDPTRNYANLDSPTYGCSVAVNMLQMVGNKRQFVNPPLMSKGDPAKPLEALTNYNIPNKDLKFTDTVSNNLTTVSGVGR